jgi:ubiquinone/menaquinone biosynthesis C-methylase UbiE
MKAYPSTRPNPTLSSERTPVDRTLERLFEEELAASSNDYLLEHASRSSIRRHIEVFDKYRHFLPERGARILDWGCNHAPDAVMIKSVYGNNYELHGCDFPAVGAFSVFHSFANLAYKQLNHIYELPYEDSYFNVVIASGVLEHVAMDYEALKEIYRVLTNNGLFIISFLPNRFSWIEFLARRLGLPCHRRRYGMMEIRTTLSHYGFDPLLSRYHQFTPGHALQGVFEIMSWLNTVGERVWPLSCFCTTMMVVARKVSNM